MLGQDVRGFIQNRHGIRPDVVFVEIEVYATKDNAFLWSRGRRRRWRWRWGRWGGGGGSCGRFCEQVTCYGANQSAPADTRATSDRISRRVVIINSSGSAATDRASHQRSSAGANHRSLSLFWRHRTAGNQQCERG